MKCFKNTIWLIYMAVILSFLACGLLLNRAVTSFSENTPLNDRRCFVIDAGHGGVDGGAVSCSGVYESHINLQIALRLSDLMRLMGYQTKMIRTSDISVYTSGSTIREKKVSDLKERVRIVNETENAILLSIHQNHYFDSQYSGAQMFYPQNSESKMLAEMLQQAFSQNLPNSQNRQAKKTEGLYIMNHINQPGVLIECGFLSNASEEKNLRTPEYQLKICGIISSVCGNYLTEKGIADIM